MMFESCKPSFQTENLKSKKIKKKTNLANGLGGVKGLLHHGSGLMRVSTRNRKCMRNGESYSPNVFQAAFTLGKLQERFEVLDFISFGSQDAID